MTFTPTPLMRRLALALGACALSSLTATGWAQDAAVPVADDERVAPMEADAGALPNAGGREAQALDTTAGTTDQSVNVPTAWWAYANVTAAQISSYITANNARLTDIEFMGNVAGAPRFSVRMVRNTGAYAVPGWWWYYGLTFAQISTYVNANHGRLIEIEPYDAGGGVIRYAVVMVSNTGAAARGWYWYAGVSSSFISNHLASANTRIVDLDSYVEGGVKKYTVVTVPNTGTDAKSWQWWINQTPASIAAKVSAFQGRIVKLDRQADGSYNFVQVKNTGADNSAWWYQYGFASMGDLINYSMQVASRPVDITTYLNGAGQRRYDAAFIDNANASTRRMRGEFGKTFLDANGNPSIGIFEAYLKQVGGSVKVDLNAGRRAEVASSFKSLHLLHSMRRVDAGTDTLASAFTYYDYLNGTLEQRKNACPNPALETLANRRTDYNFETGLDQMMAISDNRTTRGTVIRYGGFAPFNATATAAGLTGTTLRHNIGCAYYNLDTGKYDPANKRNDTTAADLAHIYEGVWNSTLLNNAHSGRTEFLESANPSSGAGAALQTIINQEAAKLGKSAVAAQFGSLIRSYGKGGSYGTCLPDAAGGCGQKVTIRSGTGLIRLPIKVNNVLQYRTYSFARLISDVKVPDWGSATETNYVNAYGTASNELYRDEIRAALLTW